MFAFERCVMFCMLWACFVCGILRNWAIVLKLCKQFEKTVINWLTVVVNKKKKKKKHMNYILKTCFSSFQTWLNVLLSNWKKVTILFAYFNILYYIYNSSLKRRLETWTLSLHEPFVLGPRWSPLVAIFVFAIKMEF